MKVFIILLLLVMSFSLLAQGKKQLIINFDFGTDNQTKPEDRASTIYPTMDSDVIQIKNLQQFTDLQKNPTFKNATEIIYSVSTHGRKEVVDVQGHSLELENSKLELSDLHQIISTQITAGKKVALLDFSCHSGADLALTKNLDPNRFCLVTGDSVGETAIAMFRNSFFEQMRTQDGASVEELYLKARAKDPLPLSSPSISTAAGLNALKEIASLENLISKSSSFAGMSDCLGENPQIDELSADVSAILKFMEGESKDSDKELYLQQLKDLKKEMAPYHKDLATMRKVLEEINDPYFNLENFIAYDGISSFEKGSKRYDRFHELQDKILKVISPETYEFLLRNSKGVFLLPGFSIARIERKLYSKIYQKTPVSPTNACKTISFKRKN